MPEFRDIPFGKMRGYILTPLSKFIIQHYRVFCKILVNAPSYKCFYCQTKVGES
jgi:hypothetical protein